MSKKTPTHTTHKPATHKTTHVTVHKTTHKTTHKVVAKKAKTTKKVGLIQSNGLLLNDKLNTCTLLAWWNACVYRFGQSVAAPDNELVAMTYAELGDGDDDGLYLEDVLNRASRLDGLFGYRLTSTDNGDVLIGSTDDHAYGGNEALNAMLDDAWLIDIVPV